MFFIIIFVSGCSCGRYIYVTCSCEPITFSYKCQYKIYWINFLIQWTFISLRILILFYFFFNHVLLPWDDDDENVQLNLIETKVNFKHANRHKYTHTHKYFKHSFIKAANLNYLSKSILIFMISCWDSIEHWFYYYYYC